MKELKNLSYAQKNCLSRAGKYMQQTEMLHAGARVGLAVSGGLDSFSMLQILFLRRRIIPFDFELFVIHLNAGFDPENHAPLEDWVRERGLAAHFEVTDHGPRAHSPENRKRSACFYCAWLRRKRLFELCRHYGLTHLAFGHTADDLITTFMMNIFQNGRVDGLSGNQDFFEGRLKVIRPLLLCEKSLLRRAARAWDLPIWSNPCPSAGETRRSEYEERLAVMWSGEKRLRRNAFNAIQGWQLDCDSKKP